MSNHHHHHDNNGHDDDDTLTYLNATLDVTATNGNGYILNGSGNPASGYSKAKLRLDRLIAARRAAEELPDTPEWWLHDLRRTAASGMDLHSADGLLLTGPWRLACPSQRVRDRPRQARPIPLSGRYCQVNRPKYNL